MVKRWFKSTRAQAFSLLGLECIFLAIFAIILLFFKGITVGGSLVLGGLVSVLPNCYFTYTLFKRTKASEAKSIVKTFYRSEVIKLVFMAILFIAMVKWLPLPIIPFVAGFFIAQMGVWLAPILLIKGNGVGNS